jgi:hypothetical protein
MTAEAERDSLDERLREAREALRKIAADGHETDSDGHHWSWCGGCVAEKALAALSSPPSAPAKWENIIGGERELWEIADAGNCDGDCNPRCDSCRAASALNEAGDILRGELALIKSKPSAPTAEKELP